MMVTRTPPLIEAEPAGRGRATGWTGASAPLRSEPPPIGLGVVPAQPWSFWPLCWVILPGGLSGSACTLIRLDEPWLGEPFVGLKNYGIVLQDGNFWNSLKVSVYFTAGQRHRGVPAGSGRGPGSQRIVPRARPDARGYAGPLGYTGDRLRPYVGLDVQPRRGRVQCPAQRPASRERTDRSAGQRYLGHAGSDPGRCLEEYAVRRPAAAGRPANDLG